jgi:hypothetical protein
MHPLCGELLAASGFRRWDGVLLLVVELPDGSPGTIRVEATDVLSDPPVMRAMTVLDADGLRELRRLVARLQCHGSSPPKTVGGK